MPLAPPLSVLLALWAPVPSSHGLALVQGPDGVHSVIEEGVKEDAEDAPQNAGHGLGLEEWLAAARPLSRVAALLPSPADGLSARPEALEAGQAVIVETGGTEQRHTGASLLVPQDSGTSVVWHRLPVEAPVPALDPGQARRDVHTATEAAIDALTDLDLARGRPDLADTLNDLVLAGLDPRLLPPSLDSRRVQLLERSLRLAAICELALEDDGGSATARQARQRSEVLRPLLAVARRGTAAATDWWACHSRQPC
ncbi:hypothetical protein D4740_01710 [Actinomyces sp. 2119]|uniref:hypothetical protein n=1 Tax=Actinomyces sp. 2119 TaxID=2321393 RepID=UPI000E6C0C41|nr:hypothetical protein [Actinomyces sp. 2119]RJF44898.1 hypothetical protein D4740_01710 [Actinomyces sp. 2119]